MRHFSVRPSLTFKGRKFKGLRGFAGKPFHPPLTDIPIGAYVIAAALDVVSTIGGKGHTWSREMWHAATFVFVAGAIVSAFTVLTGFFDWWRSSEPGTQARRTANVHALIMLSVTAAVIVNIALRLNDYHTHAYTPYRPRCMSPSTSDRIAARTPSTLPLTRYVACGSIAARV